MTSIETNHVQQTVIAAPQIPLVREIELRNIGFLQQEATHIHCVSCQHVGLSTVRLEQATCLQRFVALTKICGNWSGRHDVNHYCSQCGCFIGRFVDFGCGDRCISKRARQQAAQGKLSLKTQHKDCAERLQETRDQAKQKRAEKEAAKEAEKNAKISPEVGKTNGK